MSPVNEGRSGLDRKIMKMLQLRSRKTDCGGPPQLSNVLIQIGRHPRLVPSPLAVAHMFRQYWLFQGRTSPRTDKIRIFNIVFPLQPQNLVISRLWIVRATQGPTGGSRET